MITIICLEVIVWFDVTLSYLAKGERSLVTPYNSIGLFNACPPSREIGTHGILPLPLEGLRENKSKGMVR
jgi:hypothetical protein